MNDVIVSRLSELESLIERGVQTFVEVGKALEEIREGKLYQGQGFGTFEDYCRERWGMARRTAYNYIEASEVVENVRTCAQTDLSIGQARQLAALGPEQQRELADRTDFSNTTIQELREQVKALRELPEPERSLNEPLAHAKEVHARVIEAGEVLRVHFSSDSDEWYTPPEIISRTLRALGEIDLDPCSNGPASVIPAANRFTKAEDGLSKSWFGRVYMNPPYGREIPAWAEKLHKEYANGEVSEAIALVPARVDTDWFRLFRDYAICFIDGRLKFSGHENSAPFPSAVIYLGQDIDRFYEAFGDIGDIWLRWEKAGMIEAIGI